MDDDRSVSSPTPAASSWTTPRWVTGRPGEPMTRDTTPALEVRIGSAPGMSFHLKAPETVFIAKESSILTMVVPTFQRAMLRMTGRVTAFAFLLEPANEYNEYHYGPFFIRGRYRVVKTIYNPRRASETFRAVRPS